MKISDIIEVLEQFAPRELQEDFDNSGLQIGDSQAECTGVLISVDTTPAVIAEAVAHGCNMVVSHHPLFFKGVKHLTGMTLVERTAVAAVRSNVAVYAAHTSLDNARGGVSWLLAQKLGITPERPLEQHADGSGSGIIGNLPEAIMPSELVAAVKSAFHSPVARCSAVPDKPLTRIALCGGAGGFLIGAAKTLGAQAMITSDVRYHDFVDYADDIFIIDIGHHESESCSKELFLHILSKNFPNFAAYISATDLNPINYL